MAIVYSAGPIVNNTFTATTIVDIVDNLKTNLVNAGWTANSGSSGDWILTCVATTQGLSHKIRVYNPGGGVNCARINIRSTSGALTGTTDCFLLPDATTWRVIAHPHSFYIMKDSSPSTNKRDFACSGTLYIPTWLSTPSEAVFSSSHSVSDISSVAINSFRNRLTNDGTGAASGGYVTMYNGTMYNGGVFESDSGTLRFRCGGSSKVEIVDTTDGACSTFIDGTVFMDTPYICFGESGSTVPCTSNGILFDAVIVEKAYSYGTTKTFDSKNWMAITHNNIGDASFVAGTLFVRIT